jgi:hypothetical protein
MPNEEIKALYKELMNFFYKGKDGITPKLKFRFYANNSDYATFSRLVNNSWTKVEVEIKSTIEETISQYDYLLTSDDSVYSTQLRVLGFIIKSFGLEYYDVDIQLKTSYFYHKSAYTFFEYCYRKSPRETVKAGETRTKYWTSQVELFARAWETVVLKKLIDKNRESNYLVADIPTEDIISANYFEPYPTGKETEYIENILDRIIEAVKRFYSIGDFKPTSNVREDVFIELSKDKKEAKDKRGVKIEKEKEEKTVVFVEENKVVDEVKVEEELITDDLTPKGNLILYTKLKGDSKFKASDFKGNQVGNLVYAPLVKPEDYLKFKEAIISTSKENPNTYFRIVETANNKVWYDSEKQEKEATVEDVLKPFKDIVLESKSFDEAFDKVSDVQGVPREVSAFFFEKYNPNNRLDKHDTFLKFYTEVKGEQPTEEPQEDIQSLIDGLEILVDISEGEEKKELEDTIEGLKLLL